MAELEYRQFTPSDVEQAAQVIAQSFVDDPLTSFMLPIRANRIRTLYKFFRLYGEINIQNRRGYGVGDPLQGAAFWKFPDQGNISISAKSLGKFLPLFLTSYPIGYLRAKPILNQIETLHNKYAVGLHFYLDNLALLPSARGQGLSSRLIRPFLEMADAKNVIAYTDTVTETNVPLYEHFGFQCVAATPVNAPVSRSMHCGGLRCKDPVWVLRKNSEVCLLSSKITPYGEREHRCVEAASGSECAAGL